MGSRRWEFSSLVGIFFLSALASVRLGAAPLAETIVYENLLREFRFTANDTRPVMKRGVWVYPNVTISAVPAFRDSNNQIQVDVDMGVRGTSHSSVTQMVMRNRWTQVTVNTDLSADFRLSTYLTSDAVHASPLQGTARFSPHISTQNNFRLLNGLVARKTMRAASAQVASALPGEEAELRQSLSSAAQNAASAANAEYQKALAKITPLVGDAKSFAYPVKLSSKQTTSKDWGHLSVAIDDPSNTASPRPQLANGYQPVSVTYLHEDLIEKTIAPLLAGKQVKVGELRAVLCQEKFGRVMAFCQETLDPMLANTSILFAAERPIEVTFANDEISLKLNAVHQIHKGGNGLTRFASLLTQPSAKDEVVYQTVPYSIGIVYGVEADHLRRKQIRVTPTPVRTATKSGSHFDNALRGFGSLLSSAEQKKLEDGYKLAFKERADFPEINFPTQFHMNNPTPGAAPTETKRASVLPLETRSRDGWLVASNYLCSQGMSPIGIGFDPVRVGERNGLRITTTEPGSPGAFLFQRGDTLLSYRLGSSATGEATAMSSDYTAFVNFVRGAAAGQSHAERTLTVTMLDAAGQEQERTVTLCPAPRG